MGLGYYSACPNNANRLMLTRKYWEPKQPFEPQQQPKKKDHLEGMRGWLEPNSARVPVQADKDEK